MLSDYPVYEPDLGLIERMLQMERYAWLSLTHDMGTVMSIDGRFDDVNTHWEAVTGYDESELLGSYLVEYMHYDDRERALADLQSLITADVSTTSVVFRFLCKDGEYRRLSWNLMFSPEHESYFCTVKDVNESLSDKAIRYAYKDVLTGLGNRLFLMDAVPEWLDEAQREGSQLAVCFLDLDGFKLVNDTYGHKAGDLLLKKVAEKLTRSVPRTCAIRLGGDEFVIVMRDIRSREEVGSQVRGLIDNINMPVCIEGQDCSVGVSVGVSLFPEDGNTVEELVQVADNAMYDVKREGKNNFAFSENASETDAA
ncbi:sensor domain-containing diguanylate cyclase [Desulfovibrio mangrovi]|uniref:sensor domain-containing diguanylate cyclase n=1 Tax=Desulfovibrio mangrovi TaxID=2976983 RepID=UPI0022483243|nr:sensor domain-containing diguanylate cyclase [Desulfovibrio mangrovi]UZP67007.1 sensor domain-containing diguanylate cyclase [Desulfovibrio mangrovi]